jgi:hypothetical protein
MSRRTRTCDDTVTVGRLRKAEQFVDAAETVREFADDELDVADAAHDRKRAQRQTERLVRAARDRSTTR